MQIDFTQREAQILKSLKDFQVATVERVEELFNNKHYTRVLVADEVGLGKTLIAKGVLVKLVNHKKMHSDDTLFKAVYICSNQNIAGQNLRKLKLDESMEVENISETRLSMQHLKVFEDQYDEELKKQYVQLTPLTPQTSFQLTNGSGTDKERALIYAILKRYKSLRNYSEELEEFLRNGATRGWNGWVREEYERRVVACNKISKKEYLRVMLEKVETYFENNPDLLNALRNECKKIRKCQESSSRERNQIIRKLRQMMAQISVELMTPDLVIMDEFQRFPELLDTKQEGEMAILVKRFLSNAAHADKVKVMLLSATPYKLYSTLEEINRDSESSHYEEFIRVMNFLFEENTAEFKKFKTIWEDYSFSLSQITTDNIAMIYSQKKKAEEQLYKGICRTERMLIKGADTLIETNRETLEVTTEDILTYSDASLFLEEIGLNEKVPVEYVKSAPYIMSFMEQYKVKKNIEQYFKDNKDHKVNIKRANLPRLWLDKKTIANYEEVKENNARFTKLKQIAFAQNAAQLLWVPPAKPYYQFAGCYKGCENFSKLLVFSKWEMVPRAIAALLSYEAERLTIGELIKIAAKKDEQTKKLRNGVITTIKEKKAREYFAKKRYPYATLKYRTEKENEVSMTAFTLLYPSVTLARLFNPIGVVNRNLSLETLKEELKQKIEVLLQEIQCIPRVTTDEVSKKNIKGDERWYYMAPLLLDAKEKAIREWFEYPDGKEIDDLSRDDQEDNLEEAEKAERRAEKSAYNKYFRQLKEAITYKDNMTLGQVPNDLVDVLIYMILGSPAICSLRMLGIDTGDAVPCAVRLAKALVNRFNTPEATAIIKLAYRRQKRERPWEAVLKYGMDGNMQAMLDEYAYLLKEAEGITTTLTANQNKKLIDHIIEALKTNTASYQVDTYKNFKARTVDNSKAEKMKMRSHFAVGFYDTSTQDKTVQRKESLRLSFNSPFRPFILATTSIGQEGLDFHNYCRKIMHWNLPSNPIDIEQREGRINRYKCLAIRQNIAQQYSNIVFHNNIWDEMFQAAAKDKKEGDCELVPYWCTPQAHQIQIERIVPMYPYSKDCAKYERLIKILSLYRISLGQARQEELLEYLFSTDIEQEKLEELFMNLSPFYKKE